MRVCTKTFLFAIGCAFAVSLAAAPSTDEPLSADIFTDGEFFVGCNYWARHAGMYMWRDWRPEEVERELTELAKNGVTVMRVFPLWSDFQPLTGDCQWGGGYRHYNFRDDRPMPNEAGVDDEMMSRFAWFCDRADAHGMKLIVGIVTGFMSGRHFVPVVFEEKNVLTDSDAVMWQTRFVKYFVTKLRGKKAIVAWDLGNECNVMGAGKAGTSGFYNWMDHIAMAIRACDATRPVVSGMHSLSTKDSSHAPIRLNGEIVDVLCTHPYPFYVPGCGKEPYDTMRTALHPTAESLLYRAIGGRPCFIEEFGNLGSAYNSEERSAAGLRTVLFSAWANDLKGCLWWCNSDQEDLQFSPYSITAVERELGLLRNDFSPKPVMQEMAAFQKFRESLPFRKLPARRPNAVVVVPEKADGWIPGFGAYLLCRQAGIDPEFAGAEHPLPSAPLYVVCSAENEMTYTYPAQRRIFDRARDDGATVLVLHGDGPFTRFREQAGLTADTSFKSPSQRTFEFAGRKLETSSRITIRMKACGCEVLAVTKDGEPAFTRFRYGRGWVMVVNGPVDRVAIDRTDVFTGESVVSYYVLLREAAKTAGIRTVVEKGDCPWVCLTEHPCADGTTIVMAVNYEPRAIKCPIRVNGSIGRVWRGKVTDADIELAPNEAALFEVTGR